MESHYQVAMKLLIAFLLLCQVAVAFAATGLLLSKTLRPVSLGLHRVPSVGRQVTFPTSLAATNRNEISKKDDWKDSLAKAMGYVMGTGAMFVYAPIFVNLLRQGNANGLALSTWIFNVFGLSLATLYPIIKGFPITTYIELIAAMAQSVVIMLLVAFYQGKVLEVSVYLGLLSCALLAFVRSGPKSTKVMNVMQLAASLIANYANFPQILLSYQTKQTAWSGVTAAMSMTGCFIRILTTFQLTKDPAVMGGYVLGFLTNSILLTQSFVYKKA
jgi:mannose-P-dolichol utilization defect protein 1